MIAVSLPAGIHAALDLLLRSGDLSRPSGAPSATESLAGDGSNRRFWRLSFSGGEKAILVAPESMQEKCLREAAAVWWIGRHLRSRGVPVPELYGYEPGSGILLLEDLGGVHLHRLARETDFGREESVFRLRGQYHQALEVLVGMQLDGAKAFDPHWCWDTPRYDRQLMLERESGYFLEAFWQNLLGQPLPHGLQEEFAELAEAAAEAPSSYFLHRDYQSRNLMIKDGRVRVIDFQGGRFGPLGYDLASLLLDPYAGLPTWFQQELYSYYLQRLGGRTGIDPEEFHRWYPVLALQRNLQIVGAFAYLSVVRGKSFFRAYLAPALASLARLSRSCRQPSLPMLAEVAERAQKLLG